MNNNCIVIGGDHHNTLGVIRSLGQKGLKSNVIIVPSAKHSYVSKSKYISACQLLQDEDELIPYLLNNHSAKGEKSIIFCCSDAVASVIDLYADRLKDYYIFPCSSQGAGSLTKIMNKRLMLNIAVKHGLPVPKSWDNQNNIEFPCFIKPLVSKEGEKSDIGICRSKAELDNYLTQNHKSHEFQIQQFIEKDYEFQLIGLSLNAGEHIIIPGVSKIIRSSETSNTGYLSYQPLDTLGFKYLKECFRFLKSIGFSGLFSMEFLRDKQGRDYFMEINLRNDGNAFCVTSAGVNLPYLWYKYNTVGLSDYELCSNVLISKKVLPEFDDFFLLRKRRITILEWFKTLITADCYLEFDRHDIKPFFYRIWQLINHQY